MSTELQITPDQSAFTDKQLAALRALGVQNAPPADVALFFHQAARTGLDPFARQIYLINRGGKNTIQVGIDGFRVIRDRAGTYQGHDEEWCGPDGAWRDVWLDSKPPAAARVSVYVKDYQRPVVGVALWSEYAQIGRDGKPQSVWASKPALMLAKCAEALALRKAYPQDLSGLYSDDEMPVAEQDHDGVYVTTTMQSDPRTGTAPNMGKGHHNETRGETASNRDATPTQRSRPGGSRPASKTGPGSADEPSVFERADVASIWIGRIQETHTMPALIALREDVMKRGSTILDYEDTDGHTLDEWFNRRRAELQQAAAGEPEPAMHLSDEPGVYVDSELPF